MKDQSEPNLALADQFPVIKCAPLEGGAVMGETGLMLELLEALVRSWLETMTPIEIGADLGRVKLLKAARAGIGEGRPSSLVVDVYREVFLKDVWNDGRIDEGGAARS